MSGPVRARGRRRLPFGGALAAVVVAVAVTLAGCGLSTNDEPEAIKETVPPDAVDAGTTTSDSTLTTTGDTEIVEVFFLRPDDQDEVRLFPATRLVPRPATPANVLETLITEPPTEEERTEDDVSTDVPEDVRLTDMPRLTTDGVLIVNLSDDFYELQGETARNAFAQIVFTATGLPRVDKVQFERDGEVFNAVDGDGQSGSDPLGENDFAEMRPVEPGEAGVSDETGATTSTTGAEPTDEA